METQSLRFKDYLRKTNKTNHHIETVLIKQRNSWCQSDTLTKNQKWVQAITIWTQVSKRKISLLTRSRITKKQTLFKRETSRIGNKTIKVKRVQRETNEFHAKVTFLFPGASVKAKLEFHNQNKLLNLSIDLNLLFKNKNPNKPRTIQQRYIIQLVQM